MPPSSIRAWQYSSCNGGIEANLKLNSVPLPSPKPNQHLVQTLYVATNPVDYKPAEVPIFSRLLIQKPATPGIDFAGRIVTPAAGSSLKPGQLVFGAAGASSFAGGALREYTTAETISTVAAPEGVSAKDLSTIFVAGETAYQTIVPHVKAGDKIFINGGSGGTGIFGIQIAKVLGCSVTTTCSTANVELCKSLGADTVIDYRKQDVVEALKANGQQYSHVIDNVGGDFDFYWRCHEYTRPGAKYIFVGAAPSFGIFWNTFKARVLPGFLGGGKRKFEGFFAKAVNEEMMEVANWMKEGKVKAVIDSEFNFEDTPNAFVRQKTGRAKGKIIIDVAGQTDRKVS